MLTEAHVCDAYFYSGKQSEKKGASIKGARQAKVKIEWLYTQWNQLPLTAFSLLYTFGLVKRIIVRRIHH